ncbi:TIGR01620 family protein [Gallaecimonas sp. GXIMD4217]|uniref:TIGR01620 family protein n=1 Tax=Gallaecimonas sp. GXIMD4217 TaxID=3131927 RepID=UPI00311B2865
MSDIRKSAVLEEGHDERQQPRLRAAQSLDEADFQPLVESRPEEAVTRALRPAKRRPWLRWGLGLLSLGILGQSGWSLWQLWQELPVLAALFSAATALLAVGGGRALWREYRALKALRKAEQLQRQAASEDDGNQALALIEQSCRSRQLSQSPAVQQFLEGLSDHHNGAEVQQLFRQQVLSELDQRAFAVTRRYAGEAALMVAISPLAITDMLVVLWRNLRLIREIAHVYGLELGYWSRVKLIRQVFINLIYAGSSELILDAGMTAIGADLLGKLSGRAAQGVGAGLLTARLGWQAVRLCRPLPLDEDETHKLAKRRQGLIADLAKDLLKVPGAALRTARNLKKED